MEIEGIWGLKGSYGWGTKRERVWIRIKRPFGIGDDVVVWVGD